ncbi:MAG: response regulator [Calditrichaeota bacterium]|nr:response regulator [Calditrichota bacterium]
MESFHSILIVDDEPSIGQPIRKFLSDLGYQTFYAPDGQQALALYDQQRYDIILTDLKMPKMHGYNLIKEIFQRDPEQVIIVMTGVEETNIFQELMSMGVRMIISKPFSMKYLLANIRGILDHKATMHKSQPAALTDMRSKVVSELKDVTTTLGAQLEDIQGHFKKTITELEKQQQDMERDYIGSVRMMAEMMESSREGASSHIARVEDLANRIGKEAGLPPVNMRNLSLAALMHDIGKFNLPEATLHKRPEDMNPDELAAYQKHPSIGGIIVSSVPGLAQVGMIIEEHHENFDGSGFPAGKLGSEMLFTSRILRIADGVDRYNEGLCDSRSPAGLDPQFKQCLDHLRRKVDIYYDRTLVDCAIRALGNLQHERSNLTPMDLKISALRPGMRLAQDLYNAQDLYLLRRGVILTERSIERLINEFVQTGKNPKVRVYVPKRGA